MLRQLVRPQISTCDVFISSAFFWRVRLQLSRFSVNFAHLVTALANPGYARSSIRSYKDCIGSFFVGRCNVNTSTAICGCSLCVGVCRCRCLSVFVGGCGVVRLGVGCCCRRGRVLCSVSPCIDILVLSAWLCWAVEKKMICILACLVFCTGGEVVCVVCVTDL